MTRKNIFRLIAFILCLAAIAACLLLVRSLSSSLIGQTAAELWRGGDMKYIQQSAFISEDKELNVDGVRMIRHGIDQALISASIDAEKESARLWIDAYSGETSVSVSVAGKSVNARAICTGGDFFTFNPIDMLSGWYYSDADVMDDGVIIDKNLAWQLYGGFELSEMSIDINGTQCLVVGVADTQSSDILADAYGEESTVYMPMRLCERLGMATPVTSYSMILPNPVKGFAEKIFTENSGLEKTDYEIVQNTSRFSVLSNLKRLADTGTRAQRTTKIYFPWWENGARYSESWCTLLTAIAALFTVWPLIYAVMLISSALRRLRPLNKLKTLFFRVINKENINIMEGNNEDN
ncbi:MAG: ABC transporter permease [Oscillospiraceae bacterium]|nr:ABC transporter permease [Oscillospiraceae bacterium]